MLSSCRPTQLSLEAAQRLRLPSIAYPHCSARVFLPIVGPHVDADSNILTVVTLQEQRPTAFTSLKVMALCTTRLDLLPINRSLAFGSAAPSVCIMQPGVTRIAGTRQRLSQCGSSRFRATNPKNRILFRCQLLVQKNCAIVVIARIFEFHRVSSDVRRNLSFHLISYSVGCSKLSSVSFVVHKTGHAVIRSAPGSATKAHKDLVDRHPFFVLASLSTEIVGGSEHHLRANQKAVALTVLHRETCSR